MLNIFSHPRGAHQHSTSIIVNKHRSVNRVTVQVPARRDKYPTKTRDEKKMCAIWLKMASTEKKTINKMYSCNSNNDPSNGVSFAAISTHYYSLRRFVGKEKFNSC